MRRRTAGQARAEINSRTCFEAVSGLLRGRLASLCAASHSPTYRVRDPSTYLETPRARPVLPAALAVGSK